MICSNMDLEGIMLSEISEKKTHRYRELTSGYQYWGGTNYRV